MNFDEPKLLLLRSEQLCVLLHQPPPWDFINGKPVSLLDISRQLESRNHFVTRVYYLSSQLPFHPKTDSVSLQNFSYQNCSD
jgi:hypothetical protein